jgi:ATP-dependent RNA helicase DDX35
MLLLLLQVHYLLEPCSDYVQAAVQTVVDIHREDVPGDVLVFLTGDMSVPSTHCFCISACCKPN